MNRSWEEVKHPTSFSNEMYLSFLYEAPQRLSGKEPTCQCHRYERPEFNPWTRKIPWSRKWQPTLVFLSGKFHGQRSLAGYSPWGHKGSDTAEHTSTYIK